MLIHGNGYKRISRLKLLIARVLFLTFISQLIIYFVRIFHPRGIRFVNYHDIFHSDIDNFRDQLSFYRKYFYLLNPDQIDAFRSGSITTNRTGLIITFDDGLRSQYEYAYPVLKDYGVEAIYFVPPSFIDAGIINESRNFADAHQIEYYDNPFDSISLSWEQVNILPFVGSHTMTHCRMNSGLTKEEIAYEIVESKKKIESLLNRPIVDFCWVGGEENTYSNEAFKALLASGFERIYTSNNSIFDLKSSYKFINRNNVETCYPIFLVAFQTCGLTDLIYLRKRQRISKRLIF